jgi:hypothetical protein
MAEELTFKDEAAAEYDRAFAHVTAYFMSFLSRGAHLMQSIRVLYIATAPRSPACFSGGLPHICAGRRE